MAVYWVQLQLRLRDTAYRNKLYVDLDALAGILHLLVGLGLVLLPGLLLLCQPFAAQYPPQAFDAAGIAALSQPCPQLNDAEPGIPAAHAADER